MTPGVSRRLPPPPHDPTHIPHSTPMATVKKLHLTDLPDHILAEIFLLLPDPADLARASATCVSFLRISTDRPFLHRFRLLHAPPLLGFLNRDGFHPALPPHPSASAARALALAADFSFSFLPSHCQWYVKDIRDGRVLLDSDPREDVRSPVFAVCDPLHRRYVLLPPFPHHLAASLDNPVHMLPGPRCNPFLVPLGEEEAAAGATTFRVILMIHSTTSLTAFVFSSSTGQWQAVVSKDLSDLGLDKFKSVIISHACDMRHYAYGCFYWDWVGLVHTKFLVFDTMRMEFSAADFPPGDWTTDGLAIVEAGEGRLGMFGFDGVCASDLSYTIAQNEGRSPSQWQVEKTISVDSRYLYLIKAGTERYSLLMRAKEDSSLDNPLVEFFAMDARTLKLERLCAKKDTNTSFWGHLYTNFPPSLLSSRTI